MRHLSQPRSEVSKNLSGNGNGKVELGLGSNNKIISKKSNRFKGEPHPGYELFRPFLAARVEFASRSIRSSLRMAEERGSRLL